jgi:hypothetical protein
VSARVEAVMRAVNVEGVKPCSAYRISEVPNAATTCGSGILPKVM